jgi:hypothetical protein
VRGTIDARNLDDSVRGLEVWLEWRTTDDHPAIGHTDHVMLPVAGRAIGGRARPTFSLKAPRTPLSYTGQYFSIDWFVVVKADVAWARDPHVEERIRVQGARLVRREAAKLVRLTKAHMPPLGVVNASRWLGVAVTGAAAATFVVGGPPMLGVGLVGIGLLSAQYVRHRSRRRLLGGAALVFEPGTLVVGQPWKLRLTIQPPRTLLDVRARYRLELVEVLETGSGKSKRIDESSRSKQQGVIGAKPRVDPDRDAFLETEISTDATLPASFDQPRHELRWQLGISIEATPADGKPFTIEYLVPIAAVR